MGDRFSSYSNGLKNGLPISIGYFAVSFSLGILMRNCGLDPLQGLVMSLVNNTSAGEAAAVGIIADGGSYLEMAVNQAVINIRYFLMSAALCVHLDRNLSLGKRMLIGFDVTDEIFATLISQKRPVSEYFAYGLATITIPGWAAGTVLGIIFGEILPPSIVSALSVALYAMFIAVVIPPAKKDGRILAIVVVSMLSSWLFTLEPVVSYISDGVKIIILTLSISALAAIVWPLKEDEE